MQRETERYALNAVAATDALARLTTKQQQALVLRVEGYTYREIAGELCISPGGAWRRIDRAKDRMGAAER